MDVDDISAVAQDYLKVVWTATEWGGPPITTKALAERFATSQANVSETVKRLAGQGLVEYQPYRPVVLTVRGRALALAMVRRHRLMETFLTAVLDYGWNEVHDEAERLEHAVSELMVERIDRLLGHPDADPHGDPIPRADGTLTPPPDTVVLADAGPGSWLVVRISDVDPGVLDRLRAHRISPGVRVACEPGPDPGPGPGRRAVVVRGPDGQRLGADEAAMVRVRAAGPPRGLTAAATTPQGDRPGGRGARSTGPSPGGGRRPPGRGTTDPAGEG